MKVLRYGLVILPSGTLADGRRVQDVFDGLRMVD